LVNVKTFQQFSKYTGIQVYIVLEAYETLSCIGLDHSSLPTTNPPPYHCVLHLQPTILLGFLCLGLLGMEHNRNVMLIYNPEKELPLPQLLNL
jgi:hypothetical protein